MVNTKCEDPEWQRDKGVDTFYPHATTCFKDPSEGMYKPLIIDYSDYRKTSNNIVFHI